MNLTIHTNGKTMAMEQAERLLALGATELQLTLNDNNIDWTIVAYFPAPKKLVPWTRI